MFKSDYTIKEMVDRLTAEMKSYSDVPAEIMLMAYNSVIQKLYRGVIKECVRRNYDAGDVEGLKVLSLSEIKIKFEDVEKIVVEGHSFVKVSAEHAEAFDNTYYKKGDDAVLTGTAVAKINGNNVVVFYNETPAITKEVSGDVYIPIPDEFVGMIYAYVRGECYKWLNEDALAAKWLNDYNAQLVSFTEWIAQLRGPIGA